MSERDQQIGFSQRIRLGWLERTANAVRVTEPARGGHFAPFEEPELYAEELRAFFRPYRAAAG